MILIQGLPLASRPVRIWRASAWKTLRCRLQSRGPLGPETMAYIASMTAPMSVGAKVLATGVLLNSAGTLPAAEGSAQVSPQSGHGILRYAGPARGKANEVVE